MNEFIKIADSADLVEGKGIVRKLGDDEIALVSFDGHVVVFMNVCPHQHTPLVDKYGGQISGNDLTCPMHGWTYDLGTGECINGEGKLKMLDVKMEGNCVLVRRSVRKMEW